MHLRMVIRNGCQPHSGMDHDPQILQFPRQQSGSFFVLQGDKPFHHFDQGHPDTELGQICGKLYADDVAADDQDAFGKGLQRQQTIGGEDPFRWIHVRRQGRH